MSGAAHKPMTADGFFAWLLETPNQGRFELVDGLPIAMAPERSAHALTKFRLARRLAEAMEAGNLPCEVYGDGMAVRIDDSTVYEPDAMARCGAPTPPDALSIDDPIIIVEVLSPSTRMLDTGVKLEGYFRLPSLRHYLLVTPGRATIIHHQRRTDGDILTRIHRGGPLTLDPPRLTLLGL
jgi:Uma2 family endonuclease